MKLRFLASHSTLSSPLLRFGLVRKDVVLLSIMIVNELTVFASLTVRAPQRGLSSVALCATPDRFAPWLCQRAPTHSVALPSGVRWLPATSPRWVRRPSLDGEPGARGSRFGGPRVSSQLHNGQFGWCAKFICTHARGNGGTTKP